MRLVIVTGMSGAGKSTVLKMLEDMGYFCVDNLPVKLISKFTQLTIEESDNIDKAALGVDIRNRHALKEIGNVLTEMDEKAYPYEILFLDASPEVLIKRYKETRRVHPLAGHDRVEYGIAEEQKELAYLKKRADYIVDTSHMLVRELKQEIDKIFVTTDGYSNFFITLVSFGFKYGIPVDADLVFDVRFLPNPYYLPDLRPKTGNDSEVYDFVMESQAAKDFMKKLSDMLQFLIPNYIIEGKNQLVIAIGCTGGKHRSVTITNALAAELERLEYSFKAEHRDIEKDAVRKK